MSVTHTARAADIDEIAAEMDRRGKVIEHLEARLGHIDRIYIGAIDNLLHHQRQLDADGVDVAVSRQALEEVLRGVEATHAGFGGYNPEHAQNKREIPRKDLPNDPDNVSETENIDGAWSYSINYGPDGQEDWANLTTPEGEHVANIRTHHARRIVGELNTTSPEQQLAADIARELAHARHVQPKQDAPSPDVAGLIEALYTLAMLVLQSSLYRSDMDVRDAVDVGLALSRLTPPKQDDAPTVTLRQLEGVAAAQNARFEGREHKQDDARDSTVGAEPIGYMRPEDVPVPGKRNAFWVGFDKTGYYRKPIYTAASLASARADGVREGLEQAGGWTRNDVALGLAALDGVSLQNIRATVGPTEDANNWREYLGRADDLLAHLSAAAIRAMNAGGV